MVWLLWSCKEAAYKRWSSQTSQRSFIPKKIAIGDFREVEKPWIDHRQIPLQQYTCWVKIGEYRFPVETTLSDGLIHSWTLADTSNLLLCKVAPLAQQKDLSQSTSDLLYLHLAQHFGWSTGDISIQKNEQGRPFIYYQNEKCKLFLSMTHHGRYGGFMLAESGAALSCQ